MIALSWTTVVALFALASAQSNNITSSPIRATPVTPATLSTSSASRPTANITKEATTSSTLRDTVPPTRSCFQITCSPQPTCSSSRRLVKTGGDRDNNGCPTCPDYSCECLPKPCPPPRTCRNGSQQTAGATTRDSDGCPNCPTWLPCAEDTNGPCCEPPTKPTCKEFTYVANTTTAPLRSGCTEQCTVLTCERCQLPPCAMPPPCPAGMQQTQTAVTFPNGCPSCSKYDCIKTPECPPIVTVNCGPCPAGTTAVKVQSVCPSCDKCVPNGSEGGDTRSSATISEKSGAQVTTTGDLFENDTNGASHTATASIVAIVGLILAAI